MSSSNTILVVEDNDFVRMQIVAHLKASGYVTLEAAHGDQALDHFESKATVDMAIVDIRMDPMGGFEFIKIIRGREIDIPVILVTGDDTADLLEHAGKHNVSAVLMKPVEKDRLIKTVERTLAGARRKK